MTVARPKAVNRNDRKVEPPKNSEGAFLRTLDQDFRFAMAAYGVSDEAIRQLPTPDQIEREESGNAVMAWTLHAGLFMLLELRNPIYRFRALDRLLDLVRECSAASHAVNQYLQMKLAAQSVAGKEVKH